MMARRVITAREQHEMLSPWRVATTPDSVRKYVKTLHDEMKQWARGAHEDDFGGDPSSPAYNWEDIESFLKNRYPAAHRGIEMGMEDARPLVHGEASRFDAPYETGPEAERKYGYDPHSVAAAMVLLHNEADGDREWAIPEDMSLLTDIFTKRQKMQRDYEQRQTTAATDPQGITGVNINDDHQDYTGQILRGEKTIETRDTPTLHHAVGQRIALVSTRRRPYRPALVVGYATIGEPVFYPDVQSFDADYDRHLVGADSPHHITSLTNKTGTKYGYPMLDVEDADPFPAPPGGRVTRRNMQFGDRPPFTPTARNGSTPL